MLQVRVADTSLLWPVLFVSCEMREKAFVSLHEKVSEEKIPGEYTVDKCRIVADEN